MRIAWVSPLPPMASGIADYSFELLPLVSESASVDAVCPTSSQFRHPKTPAGISLVDPSVFLRDASSYDATFYHLGNNPFHEFVYKTALERPAVAVFHDFVLHHLIAHLYVETSTPDVERYRSLMEAEYGPAGARAVELKRSGVATDFEKFLFPLNAHVATRARAIVVHNEESRRRLEQVAPTVPVTVIPHHAGAPPPQAVGLSRQAARERLGLPQEAFIVGHFGFITRPKQPSAVIGGFARLASEHRDSLLVMTGADRTGGGLDRLIEKHGVSDRVRVSGFVDLVRFYLHLKAVDAIVTLRYPTAGETSGTFARALAEGRAVIVSDVGSFSEIPSDVALKVEVDGDQPDEVGRHLLTLAEDASYRARLEDNARRYAATHLDPARCRDLYLQVARQVAEGRGTAAVDARVPPRLAGLPLGGASPSYARPPRSDPECQQPRRNERDERDAAFAMPAHADALQEIERLSALALPPAGSAIYADLVYRLLLRRPGEDAALRSAQLSLAAGETTRSELLRGIVESREFREVEEIERLLLELARQREPFTIPANSPVAPDTTERVVEIPWVLSRWKGESRVLDCGYANASGVYLTALLSMPVEHLHGVDLSQRPVPGMSRMLADLRALPYREASFELAICISTLEHVGRDNTEYGVWGRRDDEGDRKALAEIARVLAPGGRLLLTVPFGAREDRGTFVQYDAERWEALVSTTSLAVGEQEVFGLTASGWERLEAPDEAARLRYGVGAPAARGVLCAELLKPVPDRPSPPVNDSSVHG